MAIFVLQAIFDGKKQSQFIFHRGERRDRRASKIYSFFSVVLANAAVNEKTKPILRLRSGQVFYLLLIIALWPLCPPWLRTDLKKQSQFCNRTNRYKVLFERGLW